MHDKNKIENLLYRQIQLSVFDDPKENSLPKIVSSN